MSGAARRVRWLRGMTGVGALVLLCAAASALAAQGDAGPGHGVDPADAAGPPIRAVDADDAARRGWLRDAPASPLLPADHWAVRAAGRAEALGLADGYLPAQGAVPRGVIFAVLEHAARQAVHRPRLAALAAGWLARFREEFAEHCDDVSRALLLPVNGRLDAGWVDEAGRLSPAIGYFDFREDPEALAAVSTPRATLSAGTEDGRNAALWGAARWGGDGVELTRWEAVASLGPVALSAGRQPVRYGPGEGGGVVFTDALVPRVEAQTLRPLRLPGVLRVFGGVTGHTFVSRVGGRRHPDEPWLWGARLAFQPHRRLTFAVNRGAIFGGETGVTAERLAGMLLGVIRNSTFENQILSLEGRWRLPTDAVLPATVYVEWGADDGAGALDEVPAQVAGIVLPALPGLPEVSAGVEGTRFAEVCCGHGPWFFNSTHPGNWARGTRPLAHPLGGEGWEATAFARAELDDARLRLHLRGFVRDRSEQSLASYGGDNLFAPARTGRSTGVAAEGAYRLARHAELRAAARREAGEGWSERRVEGTLSVFF